MLFRSDSVVAAVLVSKVGSVVGSVVTDSIVFVVVAGVASVVLF